MKTKIFLTLIVCISLINISYAKKWRVNNNPGISADVTTIQAAHDTAAVGDTIYIEGSAVSYGNLVMNKQLFIFGPGYFITENDTTQANLSPATLGQVTLNLGSENSLLTGLSINTGLIIFASNVIIKRNKISQNGILIRSLASSVMIIQNYLKATVGSAGYASVFIETNCSNILVLNNFLGRHSNAYPSLFMTGTSTAQIDNNVIDGGDVTIVNSTMQNNIMTGANTGFSLTSTASNFFNNFSEFTQFPVGNGNQQNVVMSTIFGSGLTSTDGLWQLAPTSAAIGAGLSGEDLGMFGGLDPYILSGIPAIPSIFFYAAPSSGSVTSGLPVNIKIKSNK